MGACCRCAKEKETRQRNGVMNIRWDFLRGTSKTRVFNRAFSRTQHPHANGDFLHRRETLPRSLSMIDHFLNLLASERYCSGFRLCHLSELYRPLY